MKNSQEANQPNNDPNPSNMTLQSNLLSIQNKQDFFYFLRNEEKPQRPRSFFSHNGLGQDIIKVTDAKPDVCLEVFYALYHVLWPQIEKQTNVSLKDAWTNFIGGSIFKGILCPPEKLIGKKKPKDIKKSFSESEGEKQIFQDLDRALGSISHLKRKLVDYPDQLFQKEEIIVSLDLVEGFYQEYRNQVKVLGQAILQASSVSEYDTLMDALVDLLEPKAVMMSDIFTNHWAYRISRNKAQRLLSLDENRRPIGNYSSEPSLHRVAALPDKAPEPLVYFKANGGTAIQPEKEFMLCSLYRHLNIPVPETALLILTDVFDGSSDYFYAVQASEAVIGESALEACQNSEIIFDEKAYVEQVLGAFLTNPSDGSFKNFKYSPLYKTLIGIDNDLVFKPEFSGKGERKIVNVKSILYLLPQIDLAIPEAIRTFFTTLDPQLMVLSWLKELSMKNKEYSLLFRRLAFQKTRCIYQNLLPQSETPRLAICLQEKVLVDPELHNDSFYPQILVSEDLLSNVSEKLQVIEKMLLVNHSASAQILFEEISPLLGKYYRKLRAEFTDPEEALDALWGEKKNGVDYSEVLALLSQEELNGFSHNKIASDENLLPEMFFDEYKRKLLFGELPIDRFIQRHSQRKRRNLLDFSQALEELQLLAQEGLTDCQSPRDIVDFCYGISKMSEEEPHLIKEITSILSNLPSAELKWLLTLEKYFKRADCDVLEGLKSSSTPITGAFMKQRVFALTESAKQEIFDEQGNIKRNSSLTGRSLVTRFPEKDPEFYLKQYPEFPGYEFASTMFMRELGIKHLPYHDLIIIDNSYPVLISQNVPGISLLRASRSPETFNNLDPVHIGLLIIAAMLLNPEDGKEDNFILSPDGRYLIPIDNDHCFLPSTFQKKGNFWSRAAVPALQTKTLLFCLDEMKEPIPLEVKQHILDINFDKELESWMNELDKLETRFNNLVSQEQRKQFLEKDTVMRIPFSKQFIHNIHWKAHKIQSLLKTVESPTPFDLLKALEPFAARCYEYSFEPRSDLYSRFQTATKKLYTKIAVDGSKVSIINTQSMIEILNLSEEDLQNDAMFQKMGPVDALELLKELSRERSERAGREEELLCELDENRQEQNWIRLFGNSQVETALKDFFMNPKEGLVLKGSKLIVTSKLTEFFRSTTDQGIKIKFLSLQDSPLLSHRTIRTLAQGCPNLEYLNVSGCGKLKEIFMAKEEWPLLARVEARDCQNLERFVSYSPMKILRIGTERKIEIFVEKSTLDILTISSRVNDFDFLWKKGESFEINCLSQNMFSHDFIRNLLGGTDEFKQYFRDLKITIGANSLSSGSDLGIYFPSVDLSECSLSVSDIQRMVMLNLKSLKKLNLALNKGLRTETLGFFIKGNWPLLETLRLKCISMTVGEVLVIVDHSKWPQLKHLNLDGNGIQDEGLQILSEGNWPLLETLNLRENKITAIGIEAIVRKWSQLNDFHFPENYQGFQEIIKRSPWPQLKHLDLALNQIDDEGFYLLAQGNWSLLETLNLDKIAVSKKRLLDFILKTNWFHLKEITCASDRKDFMQNLFPKNWHQLEVLDLSSSEITQNKIEVIINKCKWPELKDLDLSKNSEVNDAALERLAQGDWPLLETLNMSSTGVTKRGLLGLVLKTNWLNLKKIFFNLSTIGSPIGENVPMVEELDLSSCGIRLTEIEAIVKNQKWRKLRHLNLSENFEINDKALEILTQGDWPLLETLNLNETKITKKGLFYFLWNANWISFQKITLPKSWNSCLQNLALWFIQKDFSLLEIVDLAHLKMTYAEIKSITDQYGCSRLKHINISHNDISLEGFSLIARAPWPFLQELHLENTKMTRNGIETVVSQSKWPQLKCLNIANNKIFDEGILTLALAEWSLLEELNIKNVGMTSQGIEILGSQMKLLNLKKLDISQNLIKFESDENKLENLFLKNCTLLEDLNLCETGLTTKGIKNLLNSSDWINLRKLDISCNQIHDEGPEILFSRKWSLIEDLNLGDTRMTAEEIETIVSKSDWQNLRKLDVSANLIQDRGLKMLTAGKWKRLEYLSLRSTKITAEGIEALVGQESWPQLKKIDISNNPIENEGLVLLSFGNWPLLEHLSLQNIGITGKGGFGTLASGKWPLLECVHLNGTEMTLSDIESLVKKSYWPNLKEIALTGNYHPDVIRTIIFRKWPNIRLEYNQGSEF